MNGEFLCNSPKNSSLHGSCIIAAFEEFFGDPNVRIFPAITFVVATFLPLLSCVRSSGPSFMWSISMQLFSLSYAEFDSILCKTIFINCNTSFIRVHNSTTNNRNQTKHGTHLVPEPVLPLMYFKSLAHLSKNLKMLAKLLLKYSVVMYCTSELIYCTM